MSSVTLSRPGIDCVNLEISQSGNATTNCQFKQPFLLNKKYLVGVTSLSVPIQNSRMIPAVLPGLIYIRRRNRGNDIRAADQTHLDGRGAVVGNYLDAFAIAGDPTSNPVVDSTLDLFRSANANLDPAIFSTNNRSVLNISDMLLHLNSFAAVFTKRIHQVGLNPRFYGGPNGGAIPVLGYGFAPAGGPADLPNGLLASTDDPRPMFNFGVTPSGFLTIRLEPMFSNHYYLVFSNAAQQLLGVSHPTIGITQDQINGGITRYGEGLVVDAFPHIIQPANVSVTVMIHGERSLLQTLESRLSVHVESNLGIMRTITSENSVEGSNFDLASFTLENESSSRLWIRGNLVQDDLEFVTNTHCGQKLLQSRSRPVTQWSPLLHSDELTSMQLRLYMKIREYNSVTDTFKITKIPFPVENDTWRVGLRFVSME